MSGERASLNKDIKTIYRLVSDLIYLHHPITMDIRWLFHKRLAFLDGREGWESRQAWHELVSTYHYSAWKFIKGLLSDTRFRENAIRTLSAERDELLERFDDFDCFCRSCQWGGPFRELGPNGNCPKCGVHIKIDLYANVKIKTDLEIAMRRWQSLQLTAMDYFDSQEPQAA